MWFIHTTSTFKSKDLEMVNVDVRFQVAENNLDWDDGLC